MRLIASERNVDTVGTGGTGGHRGAFDLVLRQDAKGHYQLVLHMKIEFAFMMDQFEGVIDFREEVVGKPWAEAEKRAYVAKWKALVQATWGEQVVARWPTGEEVRLRLVLDAVKARWRGTNHWQVRVGRRTVGVWNKALHASVHQKERIAFFNHADLRPVWASISDYVERAPQCADVMPTREEVPRIAPPHEFGHMIGLGEDYPSVRWWVTDGADVCDWQSVMAWGRLARYRHFEQLRSWLAKRGLAGFTS